jgi:choline dehydrogenase-like flavoprotein
VLLDARHLPDGSEIESDVCIVGAGAAGITLARELAATRLTVCLLESGGLEPDALTQSLCRGDNVGLAYYPLEANRQRAFGGTTWLWAGWCRPLDKLDFEVRPWIPDSGWPFEKTELLPFYRRAHAVCDLGPFEYDPAYWQDRLRLSCLPLRDAEAVSKIYQLSAPTRFGAAYRDELTRASNVRVVLYANVMEIEATEGAAAVTRLRVACLGGARFTARARYYVLAAGGIENARLLLLSNRSQPPGLGNANDLVGRYFMEHLHFPAGAIRLTRAQGAALAFYRRDGRAAVARLFLPHTIQEREQLLNCSCKPEPAYWSDRLGLTTTLRRASSAARRLRRLLAREDDQQRPSPQTKRLRLHHTLEQAPNRDSRVTLSDERDPLGLPRVRLDWRTTMLDRRTAARAPQLIGDAFRRAGLGQLEIDPHDDDRAWPPPPLQGLRGHHMGTTRMHLSPRRGVVDAQCRVHGIANLFVAGSSVFPTAGAGTPTLTIVALALRLAEHLKTLTGTCA